MNESAATAGAALSETALLYNYLLIGALLFGMVSQGFFYTSIDGNWFEAFLGGMMLIAIFVNDRVRRLSMRERRST